MHDSEQPNNYENHLSGDRLASRHTWMWTLSRILTIPVLVLVASLMTLLATSQSSLSQADEAEEKPTLYSDCEVQDKEVANANTGVETARFAAPQQYFVVADCGKFEVPGTYYDEIEIGETRSFKVLPHIKSSPPYYATKPEETSRAERFNYE